MTAEEIRRKYLEYFETKGHKVIPRALLVPQDDPTTLFTGSGMQPLVPYLLGQPHPQGTRLVDSQTCFRAEDMDEVGDNRHTTFFEMLGNWSLGDYFKEEQLPWFWDFLIETIGLDPKKLYATCFIGDEANGVPKDTESAKIWTDLFVQAGIDGMEVELPGTSGAEKGMQGGRIFYYDANYNWWSREGAPANMRDGEPGGPDSEVFYDFGESLKIHENSKFKEKKCHPNCDCGRFLEIGNSVFMTYRKVGDKFEELPKPNVDFGGGLERIAAAAIDSPDVFQISLIKPIIQDLEKLSGKDYQKHENSMRVIADHLRAGVFLAVDGVVPSNKQQGYVLRRLLRRAIRYAFELGIEQDLCEKVAPTVINIYKDDYPEVAKREKEVIDIFMREEKIFRQTLRAGIQQLKKLAYPADGTRGLVTQQTEPGEMIVTEPHQLQIDGRAIFKLYDTYGFPVELALEEAYRQGIIVPDYWRIDFDSLMEKQKQLSQTASAGMFKGGLADHSPEVVKLHTTTHLMYRALRQVLGDHIVQRGSNITAERTRFDFSQPEKVSREQLDEVEKIVNQKIAEDLPVTWKEEKTDEAFKEGASGAFGDKYGDTVKVYTIGDPDKPFSREICGGPHVEHTGVIGLPRAESRGEGDNGSTSSPRRKFKITKEESVSAGVRRIKAILE